MRAVTHTRMNAVEKGVGPTSEYFPIFWYKNKPAEATEAALRAGAAVKGEVVCCIKYDGLGNLPSGRVTTFPDMSDEELNAATAPFRLIVDKRISGPSDLSSWTSAELMRVLCGYVA